MVDVESKCMEPLSQAHVKGRKGPRGVTLSYVDQHYVRRRLLEVFGPLGFDTETRRVERVSGPTRVQETRHKRDGGTYEVDRWVTVYEATVRVWVRDQETGRVSYRDGTAAGVGEDSQIGWSTHLAVTEAETDALKRAAMQLGDSFGLALYDKAQEHVVSEALGKALRLVDEGDLDGARALWPRLNRAERETLKLAVDTRENAGDGDKEAAE